MYQQKKHYVVWLSPFLLLSICIAVDNTIVNVAQTFSIRFTRLSVSLHEYRLSHCSVIFTRLAVSHPEYRFSQCRVLFTRLAASHPEYRLSQCSIRFTRLAVSLLENRLSQCSVRFTWSLVRDPRFTWVLYWVVIYACFLDAKCSLQIQLWFFF